MNAYNVEAVMAPIADDKWDDLRELIDVFPGTILIEDPEEPMLIIPVDAASDTAAFNLVDGLLRLRNSVPVRGRICLIENGDDDDDDCRAKADWQQLILS